MVHRLTAIAAVVVLAGCASPRVPDVNVAYRNAAVRAQAMAFYTGRDMSDSQLYSLPMIEGTPPPVLVDARQAPAYIPPPAASHIAAGARLGEVMTMWGMSIGFTPMFVDERARGDVLYQSWQGHADAAQFAQWITQQTGRVVTIFPESRLLMVSGG